MINTRLGWGDDPIGVEINDARTFLRIGRSLRIEVTDASMHQIKQLANVAADLADMRQARNAAVEVADQVAAEDGVRHIGIPFQRNGSVAA